MSRKPQPKSGSNNPKKPKPRLVRQSPASPPPAAQEAGLLERVGALENNQVNFINIFNQNMGAHQSALHAADALIHTLQRVTNDLTHLALPYYRDAANELTKRTDKPVVYVGTDGLIDFPRYIGEYYAVIGLIEFARCVNALHPPATQPAEQVADEPEAETTEYVVTEFGGGA